MAEAVALSEQQKYERMWSVNDYRRFSPGEQLVTEFLAHANIQPGSEVIDFGAGSGRAAMLLASLTKSAVTMLDFATNSLDDEVKRTVQQDKGLSFIYHDLTKPVPVSAYWGYCTDVMEHIPTEDVELVLKNIFASVKRVFFQICLVDDTFGSRIGEALHLTVKPSGWWAHTIRACGGHILYSDQRDHNVLFYVSTESGADAGFINNDIESVRSNILTNLSRGFKECMPHARQNSAVMLLAGGPSLNDSEAEIRKKRNRGIPIITVNGTYNWCLERGLKPSGQIIVDSRAFNKRFVEPVISTCRYLIASQAHPSITDGIPPEQVWLWHNGASPAVLDIIKQAKGDQPWTPVNGGLTVMLRAIPLLNMLGWRKLDIYGFDSCLQERTHHAYAQTENDADVAIKTKFNDKEYWCHPWMVAQAREFVMLLKQLGGGMSLTVFGGGLIAEILKSKSKRS